MYDQRQDQSHTSTEFANTYQRVLDYWASKRLQLDFLTTNADTPCQPCRFFANCDTDGLWRFEAILELPSWTLSADVQSTDPFRAIDQMIEQLQRQLLQHTGSYHEVLDCQTAVNSLTGSPQNYQFAI